MKILHAAPSLSQSYGGPTQSLAGYVAAARERNFEITVAGPAPSADEMPGLAKKFAGARVLTFPSFGSGAFSTSPSLVEWVSRHSREFDVIHTHGLFNPISSLSARAAIRGATPLVIRPFGTLSRYTFEYRRKALKRAWLAVLERSNLQKASALHFTTLSERNEAAWHGIEFGERAHIVPPPLVEQSRQTRESKSSEPVVLFLGRLHPVKNVESLVRAWPLVRASFPQANLVIAGNGDSRYEAKLKTLASQQASSAISFTGFVDSNEKQKLLARATVSVLPSLHENFGIAAAEALAAGVPVVLSREVQLASFVEEKALGVVCDSDPVALAEAIGGVLSNDKLRGDIARRGPVEMDERFSPRAIGAALDKMYRAAAGNQFPPNTIRKQAS